MVGSRRLVLALGALVALVQAQNTTAVANATEVATANSTTTATALEASATASTSPAPVEYAFEGGSSLLNFGSYTSLGSGFATVAACREACPRCTILVHGDLAGECLAVEKGSATAGLSRKGTISYWYGSGCSYDTHVLVPTADNDLSAACVKCTADNTHDGCTIASSSRSRRSAVYGSVKAPSLFLLGSQEQFDLASQALELLSEAAPKTCAENLTSCSIAGSAATECIDTTTDASNCGACGNACADQRGVATSSCSAGTCHAQACKLGYELRLGPTGRSSCIPLAKGWSRTRHHRRAAPKYAH